MYSYIVDRIKEDQTLRERYADICQQHIVAAKTTLLEAGRVSQNFYYIKQGCVRLWFNQEGKDITLQFFFEGQGGASIESFIQNIPSLFSIETIEPTTVLIYNKVDLLRLTEEIPALKDELHNVGCDSSYKLYSFISITD